jgi:hypothetical protein
MSFPSRYAGAMSIHGAPKRGNGAIEYIRIGYFLQRIEAEVIVFQKERGRIAATPS